jgi:thiol:disulfide interchange protein DsbC
MLKTQALLLVLTLITSLPAPALAKTGHGGECASCHTLSEKEATELLRNTGGTVTSVKQSPAQGLFELLVEREGQKGIIFMDYSKKYVIQGMVFDREKLEPVSAHKAEFPRPKQQATLDVRSIPTGGAVVMGNPRGAKKLYVFTDPDCPYCRKGHAELKKLTKIAPDVAIYVVLYPLPMHPEAYDKARAVVETRSVDILDKAFEGKETPKPTRESSKKIIDGNISFANANGISGTPTLVMPNGRIEVGMRDAETMKKMLEEK